MLSLSVDGLAQNIIHLCVGTTDNNFSVSIKVGQNISIGQFVPKYGKYGYSPKMLIRHLDEPINDLWKRLNIIIKTFQETLLIDLSQPKVPLPE